MTPQQVTNNPARFRRLLGNSNAISRPVRKEPWPLIIGILFGFVLTFGFGMVYQASVQMGQEVSG